MHDPQQPDQRQRAALQVAIRNSPSYRLAYDDPGFMALDDLRPVRLQLEMLKPEYYLRQHHVQSTVVVFGSARLLPPLEARARLEALEARAGEQPPDSDLAAELAQARRQYRYAHYYEEARRLAEILSRRFQQERRRDFVVVTGGGPGIMEAANRGAFDAGACSVGLNVTLPHEQAPNPFVTQELCFQFHYFGIRKMQFLIRARGLVAFPGGFGTLDELFEALTLMQTGKMPRIPVVLVGREFWSRAVDIDFLVAEGMIAARDRELLSVVETAEGVIAELERFHRYAAAGLAGGSVAAPATGHTESGPAAPTPVD
ncbi:TIGR00730 family Rossman fold protein [Cognatiluteimonas weifangensis]|uniref:AMP nucleosidase n=1 Tax=Cognatiluteimonas weifangensis TaxID=2303539 RepID=A0A372DL63_9GAMM|nr:TIGR00730 family Rossman fold protein [Luteimonas weifangensis]RFP60303.1 TIGR00730 family Rossman fold protein [Luteimonas weifangensis]